MTHWRESCIAGGMRLLKPMLAALLAWAANPAAAGTYVVGPDPCPAPADVAGYRMPAEVEAVDLNPSRRAVADAFILYDAPLRGWARRRLVARFILDPAGLERSAPDAPPGCPPAARGR